MKKFLMGLLSCILVFGTLLATPVVSPVHGETKPNKPPKKFVMPTLYKGTDTKGQQLKYTDKITLSSATEPVTFYAAFPGTWSVSGTGQTSTNTQLFTVKIPEQYAGYTLQLTYAADDPYLKIYRFKIQIQVPALPSSTGTNPGTTQPATGASMSQMRGDMDIVARGNSLSSYTVDANNLESSTEIYTVYQDPIFDVWVTTDADHFRYGTRHGSEEGTGVWSVNHLLVDNSYLNFDQTALNLAKFGPGTYEVEYVSKENPEYKWSRKIKLFKGIQDTTETCESGESGPAMPNHPIYLLFKDDTGVGDGGVVTINSIAQLSKLSETTVFADHVVKNGLKKIKKSGWSYMVPSVEWKYEVIRVGEQHAYPNTRINSSNRVVVLYGDKILYELGEESSQDEVVNGQQFLDVRQIIKDNDYRKGTYTIKVYNDLYRESCDVSGGRKSIERSDIKQKLTATIQFE